MNTENILLLIKHLNQESIDKILLEINRRDDFYVEWINKNDGGPHEANFLGLDNSKIKQTFNWHPIWHIDKALKEVLAWTKVYIEKD